MSLTGQAGERRLHAIGVAEVIVARRPGQRRIRAAGRRGRADSRQAVRDLLIALARQGVTATCSVPEGPRYGSAELDSNLPDVRIALGGPEKNDFTAQVLAAAGPAVAAGFDSQLAADRRRRRIWVPAAREQARRLRAGRRPARAADLPVLIVAGTDLRRGDRRR